MTDDNLTVSVTDDDYAKSSYRGAAATTHPIKIHDKSPSASGRDFPGGLQLVRNQNRTFADSVIDHHQSHQMAAGEGSQGEAVSQHQFLPNRSDTKTKSTPFDDILN